MANTTAAIMAIPGSLEPIRLVGDEEKHATLLYFGETSTLPDTAKQTLLDSVEMASGMMFPFGEEVIDVARLGPDAPPALVAMLSKSNIAQVRNLFKMNPDVNSFLDNADQFPSFTPHVTLGHPDFTEEALLRVLMKQIWRVRFDRLAVWWNDERFEFKLGLSGSDNLAMSDAIGEFLAHHGIKGQKWGVRRKPSEVTGLVARTSSADQIAQDQIAKKISKGGVKALSNADIQAYTRRLQMQEDLSRALARQSEEAKKKSDGFIKTFIKSQGARQFDRVSNKALDVAIEAAIKKTGVKVEVKNPDLGKGIQETARRLKPKK
jgi:2'-5' RNA ligase